MLRQRPSPVAPALRPPTAPHRWDPTIGERMRPSVATVVLLLAVLFSSAFLPGALRAQDTLFYQGWEPGPNNNPGNNGLYGFEQYNNQTWSQQNVWARTFTGQSVVLPGATGINEGGYPCFRRVNDFPLSGCSPSDLCEGTIFLDTCWQSTTANFLGDNGAHIITGAYLSNLLPEQGATSLANQNHTGYHRGRWTQGPTNGAGQTATTAVGLYSPRLTNNTSYTQVKVEFWVKVGGELNRDYGQLRWSVNPDAPYPPIPDGAVGLNPDLAYWTPAQYESVGIRQNPDSVEIVDIAPQGADPSIVGQLQGLTQWTRVTYTLPAAAAADPNLRIAFFWFNDDNGQGEFPALTFDEVRVFGFNFAAQDLPDSNYCPGAAISVPFELEAQFYNDSIVPNGGRFFAEMSDPSGSFTSNGFPITLGSIAITEVETFDNGSRVRGVIAGVIPEDVIANLGQPAIVFPYGMGGWRVRVHAENSGFVSSVSPVTASIFPTPVFSIEPAETTVCEGENVRLTAIGDMEIYRWLRGGVEVHVGNDPYLDLENITFAQRGTYTVEVFYRNCSALSEPGAVVNVNRAPNVTLTIPTELKTICYPTRIDSFYANVNPIGGFFFAEGIDTVNRTFPIVFDSYIAGVGPHAIRYEYTDANGCTNVAVDTVYVIEVPRVNIHPEDTITLCLGQTATLDAGNVIYSDPDNAPSPTGYLWSTGETTSSIVVSTAGVYTVSVSFDGICDDATDTVVVVTIPDTVATPTIVGEYAPGDAVVTGTAELVDYSQTQVEVYVDGEFRGSAIVDANGNWSVTVDPAFVGLELITAIARTDNNCDGAITDADVASAPDSALVAPDQIPNAFSPNGDGINDTYVLLPNVDRRFPNNKMLIFNRWNSIVFEMDGYDNSWDGGDVPDGTYFYIFDFDSNEDDELRRPIHGHILLQR